MTTREGFAPDSAVQQPSHPLCIQCQVDNKKKIKNKKLAAEKPLKSNNVASKFLLNNFEVLNGMETACINIRSDICMLGYFVVWSM